MPIANYTTKVDAGRTCAEIAARLGKAGARSVATDYDEQGEPVGVTFLLLVPHGSEMRPMSFRLPSRWEGVLKALESSAAPKNLRTEAQARRVAWRIVQDWIEAQLAIIEADVATMREVFLPYAVTRSGQTLAEVIEAEGLPKMLGP